MKYESTDDINCFSAVYSNGTNRIICSVHTFNLNDVFSYFQKDKDDPEIYKFEGTEYYIMTNMGKYFVVWFSGCSKGSISGVESKNELIKIIRSIEV